MNRTRHVEIFPSFSLPSISKIFDKEKPVPLKGIAQQRARHFHSFLAANLVHSQQSFWRLDCVKAAGKSTVEKAAVFQYSCFSHHRFSALSRTPNTENFVDEPASRPTAIPPLIRPSYHTNGVDAEEFDPFISSIEKMLRSILPHDLVQSLSSRKPQETTQQAIATFNALLPYLVWNDPEIAPCTLRVTVICHSEFTSGVGRYLCDTFSRWLVPGKFLNISSVQALNFNFMSYPNQKFFFHQVLLDIHTDDDLAIIKNHWEALHQELRLNILAVKHARHIVTLKKLSTEQKKALIEENIASVTDRQLKNVDHNSFDQMHHFLMQLTAEEKLTQIKEQFLPHFEQRPKAFQRDIFNEIKHFVLLFGEKFTARHELRYVSRLISYQYLFRKSMQHFIETSSHDRRLSVKLLKAQLQVDVENRKSKDVLGIIGAMNVLGENELFSERHFFEAILHCMPHVRKVENSFILDRRSHDPIRVFYIEIEKLQDSAFTTDEIKYLQKNLPRELKESIESVIHPVFMPRNEEEIMRNILLLSQQLNYVADLPQVIISFDTQTENELIFRVILLRVMKDTTLPILDIFKEAQSELHVRDLEVKHVGHLRKKYIKQANVFKVVLSKKSFSRKDYSIDLFKARQSLSSELHQLFKGIRDFNGGILSKQHEAFVQLRDLLKNTSTNKAFLLENFFYSLSPPLHQSLVLPAVLKSLFVLMLEALESDYALRPIFFKTHTVGDQLLLMIASPQQGLKEDLFSIVNTLPIASSDLTSTHVSFYEINCMGYIYQNRNAAERELFYKALLKNL